MRQILKGMFFVFLSIFFYLNLAYANVATVTTVTITKTGDVTGTAGGIIGFKASVTFPQGFTCDNCTYIWDLDSNGKVDGVLGVHTIYAWFGNSSELNGTATVYVVNSNGKCVGKGTYAYDLPGDVVGGSPGTELDGVIWNHNSTISVPDCKIASTEEECNNIGAYWYNNYCYSEPFCNPEHLELCSTQNECVNNANGIWFNNKCYDEPLCNVNDLSTCTDNLSCAYANGVWLGDLCYDKSEINNSSFVLTNGIDDLKTIVSSFNMENKGYFLWPYIKIVSNDFNYEKYKFFVRFKNVSYQLKTSKEFINLPDRYYDKYYLGTIIPYPISANPLNFYNYQGNYEFYITDNSTNKIYYSNIVTVSPSELYTIGIPGNVQVSNENIPSISWSSVNNADSYLIKIYKFDNETGKIDFHTAYYGSNPFFNTNFELKSIKSINLPAGKYGVRLQPVKFSSLNNGIEGNTNPVSSSMHYITIELKEPLLKDGWYLRGAKYNITVKELDKNYQNTDKTVWKWNGDKWLVYCHDTSLQEMFDYYGISTFYNIEENEGFWIRIMNDK